MNPIPSHLNQYGVMEHFYTLQGEGRYAGHASYFIRLAGCNVGCTWCDVKDSWDFQAHKTYDVHEISKWVEESKAPIAVITGGEPTLYDLNSLTDQIKKNKCRTHIETSGTNTLTGDWDWITFSPKRFKKPLAEYYESAQELKIIIAHTNDLRWALDHGNRMHKEALLYIQPEWEQRMHLESACIDFIKENPEWNLSIQTHKYLGID